MSVALSISHKTKRSFFMAKIFSYHVSCIKDLLTDIKNSEFFLWTSDFDFMGLI